MESTTIQKYQKATTASLKKRAQTVFNAWIRERDKGQPCISCGNTTELQAGHYYSAGHFPQLRFNEDNVHGQCLRCNYFVCGNLTPYRVNLEKKIGAERLATLDALSRQRGVNHSNRFFYIEILNRYK